MFFVEVSVQEGCHNIHPVQFEVLYGNCCEHDADRRELDDRGIRLSVVHPYEPVGSLGDDTCLGVRAFEC